jgi:ATP-dependent DNA helicase PIF1
MARGLPHAHILLIVHPDDKPRGPDDYDNIVCAELPNKDTHPELWGIVTRHMMHGPCGPLNPSCPCMEDQACTKKFPKEFQDATADVPDSFPKYRRRDDGRFHEKVVNGM